MKQIIVLLWLTAVLVKGQNDEGIHFEQGLTWNQVKEKAKKEHKYIFIDCFTTWCGPCKMMEEKIYPSKQVGDYYNSHFICIKVQMDKTENDDSVVKKWYNTASYLAKSYAVNAYPTFLFFSPDGNPVHKVVGTKSEDGFITVAKDAQDTARQYYSILKNFRAGEMDTAELKGLATLFRNSDERLAARMAADYLTRIPRSQIAIRDNIGFIKMFRSDSAITSICCEYIGRLSIRELSEENNRTLLTIFNKEPVAQTAAVKYINSLSADQLYTRESIAFISSFTNSPADRGFDLFYNHGVQADSIIGKKDYARKMVDFVITKNEITPVLLAASGGGTAPNFEQLWIVVKNKYNEEYATRNVINAKVRWFEYLVKKEGKSSEHWPVYISALMEQTEKYPPDTTSELADELGLNNIAWKVFVHSNDSGQLKMVVKWMEAAVKRNPKAPPIIDTYANLLYKLGDKEQAISWEKKACDLTSEGKSYVKTLTQMQNGESTWADKK